MNLRSNLAMKGDLVPILIRRAGFYMDGLPKDLPFRYRVRTLWYELLLHLRLGFKGAWRGFVHGSGVIGVGRLYASVIRGSGGVEHLGLLSTRVITTAGVNYMRDDFAAAAGGADLTLFKYHGAGTGVGGELIGNTGLGTESTTALNPDSTRATGTQDNGTAKTYKSVGTLTFDADAAVTEHGLFTTSGTGTGTLWDRSVFAAINVVGANGDSVQFTYSLTLSDGG